MAYLESQWGTYGGHRCKFFRLTDKGRHVAEECWKVAREHGLFA